ncbi:Putative tellurium resistance protein OS=Streptomyces griseus subsp. griseus (strain JCM 4626 / NBRC) OX=455632 GN=SGR_262 PE=4 SV=1 [Streptomyces griseus subsp. griseus]
MAMWDRIKDQAKGLQQQSQGTRGPAGQGQPGTGSSGGSKEKLVGLLKSQLGSLKTEA